MIRIEGKDRSVGMSNAGYFAARLLAVVSKGEEDKEMELFSTGIWCGIELVLNDLGLMDHPDYSMVSDPQEAGCMAMILNEAMANYGKALEDHKRVCRAKNIGHEEFKRILDIMKNRYFEIIKDRERRS